MNKKTNTKRKIKLTKKMSRRGSGPKTQKSKEDTHFCALNTGIRSGEYIRGIGNQTRGTLAQVRFERDFLHPVFSRTENDDDARLTLRDRINFGFFKNMTEEEKINYIRENDSKEKYLEEIDGCEMRFLSIGEDFLKLPEENQERLMSGDFIPIRDVYEMFTNKTGRRSLVFRPTIWVLDNYNDSVLDVECDEYLHLVTGAKTREKPANVRLFPIKFKGKTVGFCDDEEPNSGGYKSVMNEELLEETEWFTPSIYKALLQKCVRVGATEATHGSKRFPMVEVTITSFFKLMENPGSFVPDLQLFVSGGESAFKRLGIILVEDTTVTPLRRGLNEESIIETLFGAALCYRHFKNGMNKFVPSTALLENVVELCHTAVLSTQCYEYKKDKKINDDARLHERLSIRLIEELRSFEGDILMVKDIVNNHFSKVIDREIERPPIMMISHCLDQHSLTDIAHFMFDPMIPEMSIPQKFDAIWRTTGQNPRRIARFSPDPLVQVAQESLYFAKASKNVKSRGYIPLLPESRDLTKHRKLDPSWIAGILGPMESVISRTNTISFVNPNNIAEIVTIRKPTRDKAANEITDDIKMAAEEQIKQKLSSKWTPVREKLIDADFETQYREGQFICKQPRKKEFDWMDFCIGQYNVHCCENLKDDTNVLSNPRLPYLIASNGIMLDSLERTQAYVNGIGSSVLLRIAMYLRPISGVIQLRTISRDGKGTYKDVDWTDSYVFRYLQQLCIWMPSLITTDSTLKFTIHNFPLWQEVRNMILAKASQRSFLQWQVAFGDTRPLRVHQKEALASLIDRVSNGKRGHLIWMEPGQGKTFIVTSFLGYLISSNQMPRFCVYTLPKAATKTIEAEITKSRLPFNIHRKGQKLLPFTINIVEHDTLRTIREELLSISAEMFFVVDEMHLLMNDTQRTSVGIEIANLAADFIAMTGTLIKDNDAKNVIQWLEIVSDFPITEKNYMIGIASLISRKLDLGIKANYELISVEMNAREKAAYESVVDGNFGGTAVRTNTKDAFEICQEVIYHAIIARIREVVRRRKPIFVVAKDTRTQERMIRELEGFRCFGLGLEKDNKFIDLPPDLPEGDWRNALEVIITTPRHAAGYTLTKCDLMITGVYFGNQATREQLVGRILRMGQRSRQVDIETFHTGLLSYTQKKYESAKAVADSLRGMIKVGENLGDEDGRIVLESAAAAIPLVHHVVNVEKTKKKRVNPTEHSNKTKRNKSDDGDITKFMTTKKASPLSPQHRAEAQYLAAVKIREAARREVEEEEEENKNVNKKVSSEDEQPVKSRRSKKSKSRFVIVDDDDDDEEPVKSRRSKTSKSRFVIDDDDDKEEEKKVVIDLTLDTDSSEK